MSVRGFIVQPTYRIESGRAVVHLYGRLENGETFLVRDEREVPHFYIAAADMERARRLGATRIRPVDMVDFGGEAVARVEVDLPGDARPLRERLAAQGVTCHEADVPFTTRYLVQRRIKGSLALDGSWHRGSRVDRIYDNPRLEPAEWTPTLSVLCFDIETDPSATRLLSVALHGCGAEEVLLLHAGGSVPRGAVPCSSEREVVESFSRRVRELDPDVLTGWNVVDFDLAVLLRIASRLGMRLDLGRGPGAVRLRPQPSGWRSFRALVPGRVVLDGIDLLRGAFVRVEEYSLDAVARTVLGEGKTLRGEDRAQDILRWYEQDRQRFVDYNSTDARLALEIVRTLRLIELAVERSLLTGLAPDRVAASIASFDSLYLGELWDRGIVAPSVGDGEHGGGQAFGGHVLEPEPGLYRNVLVVDFRSLYPSVIRTFQIDPLGFRAEPQAGEDHILAPNGAAFRRHPGILPQILDRLSPRREAARRAGDMVASHAIKILMNSFYGVLGTPACRFYRPEIAAAITSFGREILLWSRDRVESYGHRVLYGDTDSLFLLSGEDDPKAAEALGRQLISRLNEGLRRHVLATWGVESRLELELERLYRRLFLPLTRHGGGGARKRYAGLVGEGSAATVVFTGLEVVRRDWTELAKRVQRELYERLFSDRPVGEYLRRTVKALRAGELDDLLVYRKSLRKKLADYTATTPHHVAAARKLRRPPGRVVSYLMTVAGPEPLGGVRSALDREHYVQKQLRPVAEPVLSILGQEFDKVIGDDTQLELF